MKCKAKFITSFVLALMVLVSCIPAFAVRQTITIPPDQSWTRGYSAGAHDPNYSSAGAMLHAVYPYLGGIDLMSRIQCRLENTLADVISVQDYVVLYEGASSYTPIRIMEGYIATTPVYFKFRGNSDQQASADVSYIGTYTF